MTENKAIALTQYKDWTGVEVALSPQIVRESLVSANSGVSDGEISMFLHMASALQLNPWKREIYLVKYQGSPAQYTIAYDTFLKRAARNPNFDGIQVSHVMQKDNPNLPESATCVVWRKDHSHPTEATVLFREFNKGQATWKQMPVAMLEKCAITRALKWAFPEDIIVTEGATVEGEVVEAEGTTKEQPPVKEIMAETANPDVVQNRITGEMIDKKDVDAPADKKTKDLVAAIGKALGWHADDYITHAQKFGATLVEVETKGKKHTNLVMTQQQALAVIAEQVTFMKNFGMEKTLAEIMGDEPVPETPVPEEKKEEAPDGQVDIGL